MTFVLYYILTVILSTHTKISLYKNINVFSKNKKTLICITINSIADNVKPDSQRFETIT